MIGEDSAWEFGVMDEVARIYGDWTVGDVMRSTILDESEEKKGSLNTEAMDMVEKVLSQMTFKQAARLAQGAVAITLEGMSRAEDNDESVDKGEVDRLVRLYRLFPLAVKSLMTTGSSVNEVAKVGVPADINLEFRAVSSEMVAGLRAQARANEEVILNMRGDDISQEFQRENRIWRNALTQAANVIGAIEKVYDPGRKSALN